jgi:predicted nucleotide-binding protein
LEDLQKLLLNPEFAGFLRLVASGGVELEKMVSPGGALDSLGAMYFRPYTRAESHELVEQQFGEVLVDQLLEPVLATTGRHPYLLFSLLRQWAESTFEPTVSNVRLLAQSILRDRRGTFEQWFDDFGEEGRAVCHALATAPGQKLSFNELRARVKRPDTVDRAIVKLNYHCLVDDTNPDEPALAGSMFRDWFLRNYFEPSGRSEPAPALAAPPPAGPNRRVFVVHGRNTRIKVALFTFLRSLGLQPIEWHEAVDACDSPAPHVSDILTAGFNMAQCAVVLLTGDDEARLHPEFQTPNDAEFERNFTGQPRPNVLFEAGMSWALFPKRTVFVKVGEVRPFSDLSGVHMQDLDGTLDRRRQLAMRLKKAGCEITNLDTTTAWQYEGDFSYTPARTATA